MDLDDKAEAEICRVDTVRIGNQEGQLSTSELLWSPGKEFVLYPNDQRELSLLN